MTRIIFLCLPCWWLIIKTKFEQSLIINNKDFLRNKSHHREIIGLSLPNWGLNTISNPCMLPLNWLDGGMSSAEESYTDCNVLVVLNYRLIAHSNGTSPKYSCPLLRRPLPPKVTCFIRPDFRWAKIYISSHIKPPFIKRRDIKKKWGGTTKTRTFLLQWKEDFVSGRDVFCPVMTGMLVEVSQNWFLVMFWYFLYKVSFYI
jgi:hypothetical protein